MGSVGNLEYLPTWSLPFATVHGQFLHAAKNNSRTIALVQGGESITYSELLSRAVAFASACTASGITRGTLVAVDATRSIDTIIGILGILFAGGIYVPIRLCDEASSTLLAQHQIHFLVSPQQGHAFSEILCTLSVERKQLSPAMQIFDTPGEECDLNDPAYVLFTSGTTNARKGVVVPHRGILRLVNNQSYLAMDENECTLLHSPLTFDASTLELWAALLQGGTVVLAPEHLLGVEDFRRLVSDHNITLLWLTAGLFHLVARHAIETFASLRQLIVGGDVIDAGIFSAVKQRFPRLRLVNGYGPTENTTFTTCYVATDDFHENKVPIGEPIMGTTVVILDDSGERVPDGTPGELATGGWGVALGYLNNPELTAQRFVSDFTPSTENGHLYLTGDIVRRREDGQLEFLGRKDNEVKLAGQRVHLDDVERVILGCEQASACAAVAVDEGSDKFLVAFIVWNGQKAEEKLRGILRSALPNAAVPRVLYAIDELPLTDNGKVDRVSLRRLFLQSVSQIPNERTLSSNDRSINWLRITEQIWSKILHRPIIDLHANFFDLGGDSLALVILQAELQKLSISAPSLVELFSLPSIKSIADYMNAVGPTGGENQLDLIPPSSFDGQANVVGSSL